MIAIWTYLWLMWEAERYNPGTCHPDCDWLGNLAGPVARIVTGTPFFLWSARMTVELICEGACNDTQLLHYIDQMCTWRKYEAATVCRRATDDHVLAMRQLRHGPHYAIGATMVTATGEHVPTAQCVTCGHVRRWG